MKTLAFLGLLALSVGMRLVVAPPDPLTNPCKMQDGKDRPFPCEFQIVAIYIMGKNNEVVGTLKPGATTLKLPKSKAVSNPQQASGESFIYNASLDFRRINTPSFSPKPIPKGLPNAGFYQIGTATVSNPLTTGEITTIKTVDISPKLPNPGLRPNRMAFTLQLNYSKGSGATILAPVQYIQLANPITFGKFPNSVNQCRDRAEAFMAFSVSVDFKQ